MSDDGPMIMTSRMRRNSTKYISKNALDHSQHQRRRCRLGGSLFVSPHSRLCADCGKAFRAWSSDWKLTHRCVQGVPEISSAFKFTHVQRLVEYNKRGELSFEHVVTFNSEPFFERLD